MKLFSVVGILSLSFVVAGGAKAQPGPIPVCPAPAGVTGVTFDQVPAAIQKALHGQTGDMAMPGQPFNATDKVDKTLPASRGVFVWTRGTRWVIVTEHGGRGYSDPVYAFDVGAEGKRVKLVATNRAVPKTVCAVARTSLDAR